MKHHAALLFAFCVQFDAASAALTDLSSRDWQDSGDGLLTHDTTSGLEWLNLGLTVGLSMIEVEALPLFDAGGANGSFRWATGAELAHLLAHLPWHGTPPTTEIHVIPPDSLDPAVVAAAADFVALVGATYPAPDTAPLVLGAMGTSRANPSLLAPANGYPVAGVTISYTPEQLPFHAIASDAYDVVPLLVPDTAQHPFTGAWLVRAAPVVVPLPGAIGLCMAALATLGAGRMRRRGPTRA